MTSQDTTVASALAVSPFPPIQRVLYARNPLFGVICQLRFPPILKIDSGVPANFQDRIRQRFPLFSEEDSVLLELPLEVSRLVKARLPQTAPKNWRFQSEDGQMTVNLSREFVALSTASYVKWEAFRDQLAYLFSALQAEYSPSYITRIGLRYQNLIRPSRLGLTNVPWSALLRPQIAAEYSSPELAPVLLDVDHRVLIDLSPEVDGKVNLRHRTVLTQDDEPPEAAYLIDNDFFSDTKVEVSDVFNRLTAFNREAGRLFRWCITDQLHDAMAPSPVT